MQEALFDDIERSAEFSDCKTWRYSLIRVWNKNLPVVVFVLVNPSTADQFKDDPTNRRGINYAVRWGFGSVVFVNLFAIRSPDPKTIKAVSDPIGPDNDFYISKWADIADKIVCAWGNHGDYKDRNEHVKDLLSVYELHHLGLTKGGHPKHILYLKSDLEPVVWESP